MQPLKIIITSVSATQLHNPHCRPIVPLQCILHKYLTKRDVADDIVETLLISGSLGHSVPAIHIEDVNTLSVGYCHRSRNSVC